MPSILAGCQPQGQPPLVVATTWSVADRAEVESHLGSMPVEWVSLASGESLARAVDRRGGVDLVLGAPAWEFASLAASGRLIPVEATDLVPWRSVVRPHSQLGSYRKRLDPRVDANTLALARATLQAEGWPRGYERLVRQAFSPGGARPNEPILTEGLALIRGGIGEKNARKWIKALEAKGIVSRPTAQARNEAMADSLLVDLLGSALVDAWPELRDAGETLARNNHPGRAEASIGERPPWSPASVRKLLEDPNGNDLVETLLDQITPDRQARDWLKASWATSEKPIDGDLLLEIASAAEGRLANEPRFRAWLRGEWTAWSRQLYRRVARLAEGDVAS